MKKIYLQPAVTVMEMELEKIMSSSERTIDIDDGEQGDPEGADSRLFFDDDEWF